MKKVFTHENRLIVFHVKNLLQGQGVDCQLKNEFASGGVGDLSPFETWPEIWVAGEQVAEAERIISQQSLSTMRGPGWVCSNCGETNDDNFMICWNCNHEKPAEHVTPA